MIHSNGAVIFRPTIELIIPDKKLNDTK